MRAWTRQAWGRGRDPFRVARLWRHIAALVCGVGAALFAVLTAANFLILCRESLANAAIASVCQTAGCAVIVAVAYLALRRTERTGAAVAPDEDAPGKEGEAAARLAELVSRHDAALRALQDSADFQATVLDTVTDGIIVVDQVATILSANAAAHRLFGFEPGELVGVDARTLADPDEAASFESWADSREREASIGVRSRHIEGWGVRKDGSRFLRSVDISNAVHAGEMVVVAVVRDVTEERRAQAAAEESEYRFRTLIENGSDLIMVLDLAGNIGYASPSYERLVGRSQEELVGLSLSEFVHPEDARSFDALLTRAQSMELFSQVIMMRFGRSNGGHRHFECAASSFSDLYCAQAIRITARDVTERMEAEEALRQSLAAIAEARLVAEMQAELLQTQNAELKATRDRAVAEAGAKSEFLSNISHEIRTPLNGIIGLGALLKDTPLSTDQAEYVETICAKGSSLQHIVDEVLDYTRLERGQLALEQQPIDLNRELGGIVGMFASSAESKGLELTFAPDESVPSRLQCDAQRLKQIAYNLLDNALKFTAEGSVSVRTIGADRGGGRFAVRMIVLDTGIGIPEEAQPTVFESFRQGDGSATRRFGGTGLGLVIVRQLVELMGGEVGFQSAPGVGTEFWVDLLLEVASGSATPNAPVEGRSEPTKASAIEPAVLHELSGGDSELAIELASRFCDYADEIVEKIEACMERDELRSIPELALALQSSASTLGAEPVRVECLRLKVCASSDNLVDLAASLERIRGEVEAIRREHLGASSAEAA